VAISSCNGVVLWRGNRQLCIKLLSDLCEIFVFRLRVLLSDGTECSFHAHTVCIPTCLFAEQGYARVMNMDFSADGFTFSSILPHFMITFISTQPL
jgi:hypothetical protein